MTKKNHGYDEEGNFDLCLKDKEDFEDWADKLIDIYIQMMVLSVQLRLIIESKEFQDSLKFFTKQNDKP